MNRATTNHAASPVPNVLIAATAVWLAAVIIAAQSGTLAALGKVFMPGYALLVAIGIAMPVAAYFTAPYVRRTVDAVGLHRLTLLHIWRIPAALMFFYYGLQGELPGLFWMLAGVGDLMAGAYAATLLWRPRTAANYRAVHVFGFADFVVAVSTGLTFTLLQDPRMALLTTLPMALIPLFGVGLSGASHIVALTLLRQARRTA